MDLLSLQFVAIYHLKYEGGCENTHKYSRKYRKLHSLNAEGSDMSLFIQNYDFQAVIKQ